MRSSNEFALFCYSYFQFNMGVFFFGVPCHLKVAPRRLISRIRTGWEFNSHWKHLLQFEFMGNLLLSIIINMYITIFKILCKRMRIHECPQKSQLNVRFGWNQTHDCLALSSDFSDTPNSASRWHGAQEKSYSS